MKEEIPTNVFPVNDSDHARSETPSTKEIPVTDDYFGKKVIDNYRWLENLNDPEVQAWFKTQGEHTNNVMNKISGRDLLIKEWMALNKLKRAERYAISMHNNRYFYLMRKPEEKVGKLYYRDGKNGEEILLFDPATYEGEKGKTYSINQFVENHDGSKVVFCITESGAEVGTIRIMNVETKKWYDESIYPTWTGITGWSQDGNSFLYLALQTGDQNAPEFLLDSKSMLHAVRTDPKTDKEIFSRKKYPESGALPEEMIYTSYSEDYKYLITNLSTVRNELHAIYAFASELTNDTIQWKKLFVPDDCVIGFSLYNDQLYTLCHKDAPKFKVLMTDLDDMDFNRAQVVLPEGELKIESMSRSKDFLFFKLTNGLSTDLWEYDLRSTSLRQIKFPQRANSFIVPYNYVSNEAYAGSTNWNLPNTLFDYNADTGKLEKSVFQIDTEYPGLKNIVVNEIEVPGHDGTMIQLSIIHSNDLNLDGSNCCIMDGYGAYGVSETPYFSYLDLALENKGVVIAYAHVRGGGEKGVSWHQEGFKTTKPNTWKDFIACAEYLVKHGYTSPQKLSGTGTSAGGIMIGRAITERPDLFGAAVCNVGLANAIRMETTPNGPSNISEFGISTDPIECMALLEMDAFLHVEGNIKYPAVMCATGMNDPRIIPWQPGKFAAVLQNSSSSGKPVLLRVDYDSGHFTEDKTVTFKNFADRWSFLLWQTGHPDFQMKAE